MGQRQSVRLITPDQDVTTLAFFNALSTLIRSLLVSFKAKKCWLTLTSSLTQPSVLPSVFRGNSLLPAAGHDGVVTRHTNPSPASFQASMPFECAQGLAQLVEHPVMTGSS